MSRRWRIGFLTRGISAGVGFPLWSGLRAAAQRRNLDLISVEGGSLGSETSLVYDLLHAGTVDGIVGWASADQNQFVVYYQERFSQLPFVSITLPVEGRHVVRVDTYGSFRNAVGHLVRTHNHQRIAFLKGSESNNLYQERLRAYRDILQESAIEFDENLLTTPLKIEEAGGVAGIKQLLDERKLVAGKDFTALVGISEAVVIGAVRELKRRGFRIPQDVAVISLENSGAYRAETPKMSAIINPFAEQGDRALATVLELIEGRRPELNQWLDAKLELNLSCGCQSKSIVLADLEFGDSGLPAAGKSFFGRRRPVNQVVAHFEAIQTTCIEDCRHYLKRFASDTLLNLDALEEPIVNFVGRVFDLLRNNELTAIPNEAETLLELCSTNAVPIRLSQDIISILRRNISALSLNQVEASALQGVWDLVRIRVAEVGHQIALAEIIRVETDFNLLREFIRLLSGYFELGPLFAKMTDWLPRMKIQGCYVIIYENSEIFRFLAPLPTKSRLVFGYLDGQRVTLPEGGQLFPTSEIIPRDLWPSGRLDLFINPIIFAGNQIGYVAIDQGPTDPFFYSAVAGQLGSSLQGSQLLSQSAQSKVRMEQTLGTVLSKASIVSDTSQQISNLVQAIAATMETLTTDIRGLMARAVEVMTQTTTSVEMAAKASDLMETLFKQSAQIGEINNIISDITERTRLLSINAGIEAARAHEAGRGFMPIAHEVKKLAEETGRSTIHINEMIDAIRSSAGGAQSMIGQIVAITNRINDLSKTIEAAVARHMDGSTEISRQLVEAADGSRGIFAAISELSKLS